ncbi:MAG: SIR2 family protein, partial [Candidatus Sulfotelmatobacter sp.]
GSGIASVASDFEMVLGRPLLLARLLELLNLPGGVKPTPQHLAAVALFPRIITTNYDGLFESAAQQLNSGHALVLGPNLPEPAPEKFIWKIHGDPSRSDVLVVSEADIEKFGTFTSTLLANLRPVLSQGPLLIAGTSLRDPSIMRLFHELRGGYQGYWPVPVGNPLAVERCKAMGLQALPLLLEDVLGALLPRRE